MNSLLRGNFKYAFEDLDSDISLGTDEAKTLEKEVTDHEENAETIERLENDISSTEQVLGSDTEPSIVDVIESETSMEAFSIFFTGKNSSTVKRHYGMESVNSRMSTREMLKASLENKKQLLKRCQVAYEELITKLSDNAKLAINGDVDLLTKVDARSLKSEMKPFKVTLLDILKSDNPFDKYLNVGIILDMLENPNVFNASAEDNEIITDVDVNRINEMVKKLDTFKESLGKVNIDQSARNVVKSLTKEDFKEPNNWIFAGAEYDKRIKDIINTVKAKRSDLDKLLSPKDIKSLESSLASLLKFNGYFYLFIYGNLFLSSDR